MKLKTPGRRTCVAAADPAVKHWLIPRQWSAHSSSIPQNLWPQFNNIFGSSCVRIFKVKIQSQREYTCFLNRYTCFLNRYTCLLNRYMCFLNRYMCFLNRYMCFLNRYTCFLNRYTCFLSRYTCFLNRYMCFLNTSCIWRNKSAEWPGMSEEAAEGSGGPFKAVFGNHCVELATKSI